MISVLFVVNGGANTPCDGSPLFRVEHAARGLVLLLIWFCEPRRDSGTNVSADAEASPRDPDVGVRRAWSPEVQTLQRS